MRRLFAVAAVFAAVLLPATAASATPTGEFAKYKNCPLTNPNVEFCVFAETTAGSITTGAKTVPIKNPVYLQGGLDANGEIFGPLEFYGASNGETLSKTPQPVPGGLLGVTAPTWWPLFLQNLFNETINNGFTGVNATMELAGPPTAIKFSLLNSFIRQGTTLGMPVKIKLSNPFLGNNCYIGSNSSPIQLNLTTGKTAPPPPNTPIVGSPGTLGSNEAGTAIFAKNNRLVENAFAVPGANGCGGLFSFLIDPFVNSIVGVPSAAGTNAAILEGSTEIAYAPAVIESE